MTSAILGESLPALGFKVMALTHTAPSSDKSKYCPFSQPFPKVPEAVTTGFLRVTPAIFTLVFIFVPSLNVKVFGVKHRTALTHLNVFAVGFAGAHRARAYAAAHSLLSGKLA